MTPWGPPPPPLAYLNAEWQNAAGIPATDILVAEQEHEYRNHNQSINSWKDESLLVAAVPAGSGLSGPSQHRQPFRRCEAAAQVNNQRPNRSQVKIVHFDIHPDNSQVNEKKTFWTILMQKYFGI